MGGIADELVSRDRSMREEGARKEEEKSIIGLLCELLFLKWCEWEADKGDSESGG